MISSLHGTVAHTDADALVVEVGGVGLSVAVPPDVAHSAHLGDRILLHTHLVVREDALALFGFAERDELAVFQQLLGVPGIGPRSALGVLAQLSVDSIARAVADEDDAPFRRVSGIGPKTAKLIVVHLAGKLAAPAPHRAETADASTAVIAQVTAALAGLGWPERLAADTVTAVAEHADATERASVNALLRRALAELGPARGSEARHG